MHTILQNSVVFRFLASIYSWFGVQWENSFIVSSFLAPARERVDHGVISKAGDKLHALLYTVFHAIRLDKISEGSIFRKPFIWFLLSVALAPLVPTKALIALCLVGYCSVLLSFGSVREMRCMHAPFNLPLVLYAAVYAVAVFSSVTISGSISGGLLTILFVLYVFVCESSISTARELDITLALMICAGALVAAYGVYQYVFGVTGADAWVDSDMFSSITTRVYSTLDNPNVLAEYLLLIMPFAFAYIIVSKKTISKLFFLCCFGAMGLCMILTYSRGGWLGLLFAMALFLVLIDRRFIVAGIVGLVVLYFALPDTIISRFTSIGNLSDTSTSYRLSIWIGSIAMLKDYWICGIGPGTSAFNLVYPSYSYSSAAAQHAHNLYLQITCDAGICGLILFLLIIFFVFKNLARALKVETDKKSKFLQMAAICSVFGFLVQSMTDYSFYNYRVTMLFWAVVGISAVIAKRTSLTEK